jgi:hypothetical protein
VLLPHMVQMLTSESNVVHSYAATTMEQLLNMKVVHPLLIMDLLRLFFGVFFFFFGGGGGDSTAEHLEFHFQEIALGHVTGNIQRSEEFDHH